MQTQSFIKTVFLVNAAVILLALIIYMLTGRSHFSESGFVTIFSSLQLLAIARVSFLVNKHSQQERKPVVWKLIGLGFIFLAADESFKIHENIDSYIHYLFQIEETAISDRLDDLIIGIYGVIGLITLYICRDQFTPHKDALRFFVLGFIALFSMVIFDTATNRNDVFHYLFSEKIANIAYGFLSLAEEPLKVLAEAFFLVGFYVILQNAKARELQADTVAKPLGTV